MFQSIKELQAAWKSDARIDITDLATESLRTPSLHSKYLDEYVDAKKMVAKAQTEIDILSGKKMRYWRGEMSPEECDELGWKQWQYNKIALSQQDAMLAADEDVAKLRGRLTYWKLYSEAAESILSAVQKREFSITNALKFILYSNGAQV